MSGAELVPMARLPLREGVGGGGYLFALYSLLPSTRPAIEIEVGGQSQCLKHCCLSRFSLSQVERLCSQNTSHCNLKNGVAIETLKSFDVILDLTTCAVRFNELIFLVATDRFLAVCKSNGRQNRQQRSCCKVFHPKPPIPENVP